MIFCNFIRVDYSQASWILLHNKRVSDMLIWHFDMKEKTFILTKSKRDVLSVVFRSEWLNSHTDILHFKSQGKFVWEVLVSWRYLLSVFQNFSLYQISSLLLCLKSILYTLFLFAEKYNKGAEYVELKYLCN